MRSPPTLPPPQKKKKLECALTCFDCFRETETALDSLGRNRTRLSSTGSKLIEMKCQQMKSNENEITTHLNGSFAVPFTMTIKTIVISNHFDGEWNTLKICFAEVPGDPEKVLPFDKASNSSRLVHYLNVFRF